MITYVHDFLLTGQHHIHAVTKELLAKYVIKKSVSLPKEKPEKGKSASEGIDFLGPGMRDDDDTVWCGQSKYILHCVRENDLINEDGQVVLKRAWCESTLLQDSPRGGPSGSFQGFNANLGVFEKFSF